MPDHPTLLNNLGVAQYRCGHYAEAARTLARAIELRAEPQIQDVVFHAMALWRIGRHEEARAELQRARDIAAGSISGRYDWRRAFIRQAEVLIENTSLVSTSSRIP